MTSAGGDAMLRLMQAGTRWILATHVHPDGDGIGSQLALASLLESRGCEARIINADPVPVPLHFVDAGRRAEVYDPARHDEAIESADVVAMLDNSDPKRLGALEGVYRRARGVSACIDHHPEPDPFWQSQMIRETACCTGELVHELYLAAGETPTKEAAEALYVALVSDTGRFRFANVGPGAFRMAAALAEAGADPARVSARLDETLSEGFLALFAKTLSEIEVRCEGRLVVLTVWADDVERFGAAEGDTSEIINHALLLESSRAALLLRELEPRLTKVSLRSKGSRDVNELARRHGGGGHRNASGAVIEGTIEEARSAILPALEKLARS